MPQACNSFEALIYGLPPIRSQFTGPRGKRFSHWSKNLPLWNPDLDQCSSTRHIYDAFFAKSRPS